MGIYLIKLYERPTDKKQIFTGQIVAETAEEALKKYAAEWEKLGRKDWYDKFIKKISKQRGGHGR